jgi:hypothetical protein
MIGHPKLDCPRITGLYPEGMMQYCLAFAIWAEDMGIDDDVNEEWLT